MRRRNTFVILVMRQPRWRHCPMITRDKDGRVKVNKVIYHTEGCPFTG